MVGGLSMSDSGFELMVQEPTTRLLHQSRPARPVGLVYYDGKLTETHLWDLAGSQSCHQAVPSIPHLHQRGGHHLPRKTTTGGSH